VVEAGDGGESLEGRKGVAGRPDAALEREKDDAEELDANLSPI